MTKKTIPLPGMGDQITQQHFPRRHKKPKHKLGRMRKCAGCEKWDKWYEQGEKCWFCGKPY